MGSGRGKREVSKEGSLARSPSLTKRALKWDPNLENYIEPL